MVQLLLRLRDSMHHYQGIRLSNYLLDIFLSIFWGVSPAACQSGVNQATDEFCDYRPCVLYSDNSLHNSAEVADDLSKCSIKEVEKPRMDRSCGIPMARLPLQVPQSIQGVIFFPHCLCSAAFCLIGFLHASFSIWALLVFCGITQLLQTFFLILVSLFLNMKYHMWIVMTKVSTIIILFANLK